MKQKTFARSSVNLAALAGLALAITSAHAAPVALINGNLETPGTNFPALNANINPAHGWINPGGNSWALTTTGPSSPQEAGGSGAMHGLINGLAGGDAWQITSTPMVEGTTYTAMMDIYHRDFSSLGNGVFRLLSDTVSGGGGTRTILNSTTGISAPAGVGQWLLDVTVQYTATASDAGKFIGVAIGNSSGGNNWIEFDNMRLDASIGDSIPPTITGKVPGNGGSGVAVATNLVATFSEDVQKGTGNIVIKKYDDDMVVETIDVTTAAVGVSGKDVTINPGSDLADSTKFYVEIPVGAIKDLANNDFAGLSDKDAWNFTTLIPDLTAPGWTNLSPADEAVDVPVGTNLVITFDENVQEGSGNLVIKESGGSVFETIPFGVSDARISISGAAVTIDPTDFMALSTGYYVEIDNGAIKDLANNNFAGFTGSSIWSFTTGDGLGPVALINGNLETPGTNFPALNANINPAHGWINPGGNSWALTTTGPSSPQEAGGSGSMHGLINGLAGGDTRQITSTPMVEGTTYTARMDIYHRDFSSLGNGVFRLLSDTVSGGGGTRTILNSTTGISAPAGVGQWLLDVTVRYTATASDAGKFIGIAIGNASGGNNWIEFDNVRLDASIGGDTPFADWAAGYTPPMIAGVDDGFGDDHDLDGTPNGHEFYFFDSDPTVAGAHGSPISGAARTAANKFEFTHNRRLDRTDVTETYQWSSDLDNWYDADGLASDGTNTVSVADKTVVAGPTANLETVTVEATVGGGTMSKLFLRLNLSSP